ncbi:MAG: radical SAM protein [Alphaproteobacteria bacterium]|nr:radical SAM protein [Alphaproteobacteria bacterium]
MDIAAPSTVAPIDTSKFRDPRVTADGAARASVSLKALRTLWINTGTLCNLTCVNCYIESSPTNDRLVYITTGEVGAYLDEIAADELFTEEIGYTGGEPFMNPDMIDILDLTLSRGFRALVLTNAMRPMAKVQDGLLALREKYGAQLVLRVSVDHYDLAHHEKERGPRSWQPAIDGLKWLSENGFNINIAGRTFWNETQEELRTGYGAMFTDIGLIIDSNDPVDLVLFPEMDEMADVPEITTACWNILDVSPDAMMCATSRMVVKRRGADKPVVMPCTLLPYDERFEMGGTLADAAADVPLNHPHCAKFCVLGGGACSAG